jgi:hypothetical protein
MCFVFADSGPYLPTRLCRSYLRWLWSPSIQHVQHKGPCTTISTMLIKATGIWMRFMGIGKIIRPLTTGRGQVKVESPAVTVCLAVRGFPVSQKIAGVFRNQRRQQTVHR